MEATTKSEKCRRKNIRTYSERTYVTKIDFDECVASFEIVPLRKIILKIFLGGPNKKGILKLLKLFRQFVDFSMTQLAFLFPFLMNAL